MKWRAEFTVDFTPLPPEMEAAYWKAMEILAEILAEVIAEEQKAILDESLKTE